jgi:hypothetical protein
VIQSLRPGSRHDKSAGIRQARRPWALAATGATATAIPGVPGLAFAVAGNPHAPSLLISSGLVGLATMITTAVVRIYESSQRTRRVQLQLEGSTAIAQAMARCIDDSHADPGDLPEGQRASEAANMRASAEHALTDLMPAVLAVFCQHQPSQVSRPEAPRRDRHRSPSGSSSIQKPA